MNPFDTRFNPTDRSVEVIDTRDGSLAGTFYIEDGNASLNAQDRADDLWYAELQRQPEVCAEPTPCPDVSPSDPQPMQSSDSPRDGSSAVPAPRTYRKEIVYDEMSHDFALYLDNELVGFAATHVAGERTLNEIIASLRTIRKATDDHAFTYKVMDLVAEAAP